VSKITNKFGLPDYVVAALTNDGYSKGKSNRSVTQLIDSPQIVALSKDHADEIEIDVTELLFTAFGTNFHKLMESGADAHDRHTSEERLFAAIDGWRISGAIDLQSTEDDETVTVTDHKTCSVWSVIFGKKEWERQLNVYAWLVEVNGKRVSALQVAAFMRDWKRRDAETKSDYPQSPIMILDIPLWSFDERDEYVRQRVALHQDTEYLRLTGDKLPPCSDEERWMKPTTYAVKKPANKRAIRVFSSFEEAKAYVKEPGKGRASLIIEERKGEATRCKDWCRVSRWCKQWQEENDGN
jgi:hypothetical protein